MKRVITLLIPIIYISIFLYSIVVANKAYDFLQFIDTFIIGGVGLFLTMLAFRKADADLIKHGTLLNVEASIRRIEVHHMMIAIYSITENKEALTFFKEQLKKELKNYDVLSAANNHIMKTHEEFYEMYSTKNINPN